MKALYCEEYGPPESVQMLDRPAPEPVEGELLIQVHAAGVNFPDLLMMAGQYQVKTPPPFIPGCELAGTVLSVGAGVKGFLEGDRVAALTEQGAFAEQCVVKAATALPIPDAMTFEQAAGFTVTYAPSYHALKQCARLQSGETVLVLGAAGGVGTSAIEIAKAMGARVIAAASSAKKCEFAAQNGADETVDYSRDDWREEVRKLTNGSGVDVVYDPVGGDHALSAFKSLAWNGRHLVIGFASGDIPAFPANIALLKEAQLVGVWWGTWSAKNPQESLRNIQELVGMIKAGSISPGRGEIYAFDDYLSSFRAIAQRQARGKVILRMR